MSLQSGHTAKCDHCGATSRFIDGDSLEVERTLRKRGWRTVRYDYYGNTGHYCQDAECQEEARLNDYLEDAS